MRNGAGWRHLVEHGPNLVDINRQSAQSCPKLAPNLTMLLKILPILAEKGQSWPSTTQIWSKSAQVRPSSVLLLISAQFGIIGPTFVKFGAMLVEIGQLCNLCRKPSKFGRIRCELGRHLPMDICFSSEAQLLPPHDAAQPAREREFQRGR